ncbi:bacteriocin-protection protein [marine bacterium AO1-C]|nr:bacteriocin-protection protein [marine bacterium AO1-C]
MNDVLFFATPAEFREWLAQNHDKLTEQWIGFYKKASKKPSITWSESVDQALCYGWIDGLRKKIDDESYKIRFTPRRKNSIWSAVNLKKMKELIEQGLMQASGLAIYEKRDPAKEQTYGYEQKAKTLPDEYLQVLKAHKKAWEFFSNSAPFYQRQMAHWVVSAKKEETQLRRLEKLITYSEQGKKVTG